jgi:hypothetical protein
MALKTLQNVDEIGGFSILHINGDNINMRVPIEDILANHIMVNHITNTISFRVQDGPIGEQGINGCQIDTIIESAKIIIEGLNKEFPCRENSIVITKLDEALMWLKKRKEDREKREVEGTSQL